VILVDTGVIIDFLRTADPKGAKLGWSQSRVSKFESSDDSDLRFGDIIAWLSVLVQFFFAR
jgi:hypothetical protein